MVHEAAKALVLSIISLSHGLLFGVVSLLGGRMILEGVRCGKSRADVCSDGEKRH